MITNRRTLDSSLAWFVGLVGAVVTGAGVRPASVVSRRDERGLSQSTENAILLAGAVTVAGIVIAVITVYVRNNLPK